MTENESINTYSENPSYTTRGRSSRRSRFICYHHTTLLFWG